MSISALPLPSQLQSTSRNFPFHNETDAFVAARSDAVFEYADDHEHLSMHMGESSAMMAMGKMTTTLDAARGQSVGSEIRLSGKVLGMRLQVVEKVTERQPPRIKVWETTESPRLLIIGHYRMGFEVVPHGDASHLRVFIDFALPESRPARWFGYLFARFYARWCTKEMVEGVCKHFEKK